MPDPLWEKKFEIINKYGVSAKILDIGCNEGEFSSWFNRLGCRIIGLDIAEKNLKLAKKRGIKTIKCDLNKRIPLPSNSFKTVFALEIIEHLLYPENIPREANRLLKKNGKLYISTPYFGLIKRTLISLFFFDKVFHYETPHIRFFSEKSFKKLLRKNGFKIIKLYKIGRIKPFSMDMFAVCSKN